MTNQNRQIMTNSSKNDSFFDSKNNKNMDDGDEDIFDDYILSEKGINFNYLFFPGLIAHEFAHYLTCLLAGSKVVEVLWWSADGGHVVHHKVGALNSTIISFSPFIFNNILVIIAVSQAIIQLNSSSPLLAAIYLWLGFSFAVYSIPSLHDLKVPLLDLKQAGNKIEKINPVFRIVLLVIYSIGYVFEYAIVSILYPIAKYKDLRIGWAILLMLFITLNYSSFIVYF